MICFVNFRRPSGDPETDVELHMESVHAKFNHIFNEMLKRQQEENAIKLTEITRLEADILRMQAEMEAISDRLEVSNAVLVT